MVRRRLPPAGGRVVGGKPMTGPRHPLPESDVRGIVEATAGALAGWDEFDPDGWARFKEGHLAFIVTALGFTVM